MKIFYLIAILFSLIFISCSSTYRVSDFSSKEKYYQDFNNFARNKNVKVTLINDSSFFFSNGVAIENDTLYSLIEGVNSGNLKLALSDTKEINYTSNDYKSASILLNNGNKYQAEQIKMTQDSITFAFTKKLAVMKDVTSINNIKIISYKNHWLGVVPGFLGGTALGVVSGLLGLFSSTGNGGGVSGQDNVPNPFGAAPYLIVSGAIIGSTIGWIAGFNYTYQFNP